ncbi:MAG: glycine cleavage system protein GcvH [Thermoplasmata archaeon]
MTESKILDDRTYTKSHEWWKTEGDRITLGITDHAQSELTDIVFVDLPKVGAEVHAGQSMLVLESVKTVADVYAPTDGSIVEVNTALREHPEFINQDPYGKGWIVRIRPHGAPPAPDRSLPPEAYRELIAAGGSH